MKALEIQSKILISKRHTKEVFKVILSHITISYR